VLRRAAITAPLLALALACGCGGTPDPPAEPAAPVSADGAAAPAATATPEPVAPAATPTPAPEPATDPAALPGPWTLARVRRRVALRERPGGARVGSVGRRTEFGSPRIMNVLRRRGGWLEVVAPELPNGRAGWIPAGRADVGATDLSLRIDLSEHRLSVRRDGRTVEQVTVGIGAPDHPTPTGRFAITDKLLMGGAGTTYGCCALALSAHQPHLPQGWSGLDRVAIHGTQSPETIGTASSLGCMHASDRDLRRLLRLVPLGAPVFVSA
jgi:L,D-transpeptidase catalytic domain